jgi:signal transduction histidine kinase
MNFAEVVRAELTRIQQGKHNPSSDLFRETLSVLGMPPTGPPPIDPAAVRLSLIEALERLQAEARAFTLSADFTQWQEHDRVVRFAETLAGLLMQSIGRSATSAELHDMISLAIARRIGLRNALSSPVKTMELDRLSDLAWEQTSGSAGDRWQDAAQYTLAVRAAVRRNRDIVVSPVGQVLLQLTGKDAIRWLLNVEVAQSTGPRDEWRVSRDTAIELIKLQTRHFPWDTDIDEREWPHSWKTLHRLAAFDLLNVEAVEGPEFTLVEVLPLGYELLGELASGAETPMSIFAGTVSQDLTAEATGATGAAIGLALRTKGTAVATRQARLVAHEIRNALVPVRVALDGLYRDVALEKPEEVVQRSRPILDEGVHRALTFVEQLLDLATLSSAPPERFSLGTIARDAISQVHGINASANVPDSVPALVGNRIRVLLALTNLLDNAKNASAKAEASVRISAASDRDGSVVVVYVDDDGPGIQVERREQIFSEGYTTTPGRSGLGLALVREVFEAEMGGRVICENSPLGGARFTIRLPVKPSEKT